MIDTMVDLPAPFGPIRPVMVPARTSKLTLEQALTPPNRWWTLRTKRSADGHPATIGSGGTDPIEFEATGSMHALVFRPRRRFADAREKCLGAETRGTEESEGRSRPIGVHRSSQGGRSV